VRNQFAVIEETAQKKKRLDVVNWLAAVDSVLDQEASAAIRHDYPSTGKWVLQDVKIKSWMDPNNAMVPIMWMNGIPGAGGQCRPSAAESRLLTTARENDSSFTHC
jgi:hypothetical protein